MEKTVISDEKNQEETLLPSHPDASNIDHHQDRDVSTDPDNQEIGSAISSPPPDGGYGWVVVAASFFSLGIVGGHFMSFGLLYPAISAHYDVPYGVSGWVGSFSQATMHVLGSIHCIGFVYSSLVNRYGCRICSVVGSLLVSIGYITSALTTNVYQLYITYGLITGMGIGLVFLSNIVIVQQYFHKRRALAAGLSNSGISLGIVGMSLLVNYFLSEYGWKGTSLLVGGICLHGVIAGYFLRPLKAQSPKKVLQHGQTLQNNKTPSKRLKNIKSFVQDIFDFSLLKRPFFQLYCWTTFCTNVGLLTFYMHTPNRALHLGIDPWLVGWLPSSIAVVTFFFRVIMSFVANFPGVSRIAIYVLGIFIGGLLLIVYFLCTSAVSIFMMCFATGATIGIYQTVQPTILVDLLGIQHIAKAQALLSLYMGTGSLIATPFAGIFIGGLLLIVYFLCTSAVSIYMMCFATGVTIGFLYDLQQDYMIPFLVCGSVQTFGALLGCIIYCFNRRISSST